MLLQKSIWINNKSSDVLIFHTIENLKKRHCLVDSDVWLALTWDYAENFVKYFTETVNLRADT